MKVVLATHKTDQYLGVNKYFYLLGKYLCDLGVDVRIIVDHPKGKFIAKTTCNRIKIDIQVLGPTATNPVNTLRYCRNLSWYLTGCEHNILHCGHVLPYFYLTNKNRQAVVFQPFGNELFTLSGRGMNPLYCKLAQPVLRSCGEKTDVLLAEGEFQVEEMKQYYPNHKRMEVLPVGVEMAAPPKENYNVTEPIQFLAVNSLLLYEGMGDLIYAFRAVNAGARLIIVGKGGEESKLKRQADGLNVVFKKDISEMELKALYKTSDCFVNPSYETDFQMGVLEAMSVGLPVISRGTKWLPYSVMQFGSLKGLREAMQEIMAESASRRAERVQKGYEWVKQYSFTEIADQALKIYKSLV